MECPFLSVIVPVYNDNARLAILLESLGRQTYPGDLFEIIVVDNGSAEDVRLVTGQHEKVTLLYERDVQSSYAARNKGIGQARGDILVFTDSDCRASEGWLEAGVKKLVESNRDMVGGQVAFDFSRAASAAEYYDAIHNFQFEEKIQRGTCATANLFVRRTVFAKIGLFPQNLKSGGDIYFSRKATDSGLSLVYARDATVHHPTRGFWPLVRKMFRVGTGKAVITRMASEQIGAGKIRVVQTGGIAKLFSFTALQGRIRKRGYQVGPILFFRIWCTGCCVLAAGFAGLLYGRIKLRFGKA